MVAKRLSTPYRCCDQREVHKPIGWANSIWLIPSTAWRVPALRPSRSALGVDTQCAWRSSKVQSDTGPRHSNP